MPATFTLGPGPFPAGTTVGAYAGRAVITDGGVAGPLVASAVTGTDSTTVFTGLAYSSAYWAAASVGGVWHGVAFATEDPPAGPQAVLSVSGRTGDVVLVKADVGLALVDNTADAAKPVSGPQATAIAAHATRTDNPHTVTKAQVGLASVDDTSDSAKPVSAAQQDALDLKLDIADVVVSDPGRINVKAAPYSAVGDGVTDDRAALQAAIDAAGPGEEVYLPGGVYGVLGPLNLKRNSVLVGTDGPQWTTTSGTRCEIVALSGFAAADSATKGLAVLRVLDKELLGVVDDTTGGRVERIGINGGNITNTIGLLCRGKIVDWEFNRVRVRRCASHGFYVDKLTRADTSVVRAQELFFDHCSSGPNSGSGYRFVTMGDSYLDTCLSQSNIGSGYYFTGGGNLFLADCHAEWNQTNGYWFDDQPMTTVVMDGCATDRNYASGVLIEASGVHPWVLSGLLLRRDGRNGGSVHAGLKVAPLVTGTNPPIMFDGAVRVYADDDATGTSGPYAAVRLINASRVRMSGYLWGDTVAYGDGGGNTIVGFAPGTLFVTGAAGAEVTSVPLSMNAAGSLAWTESVLSRNAANQMRLTAAALQGFRTGASDAVLQAIVGSDTFNRFQMTADGGMAWGDGSATRDVTLDRVGPGRLHTNGALDLDEISAPVNPAANRARVYSQDNGAGKTQLMARFPSGAAIVLATEP